MGIELLAVLAQQAITAGGAALSGSTLVGAGGIAGTGIGAGVTAGQVGSLALTGASVASSLAKPKTPDKRSEIDIQTNVKTPQSKKRRSIASTNQSGAAPKKNILG